MNRNERNTLIVLLLLLLLGLLLWLWRSGGFGSKPPVLPPVVTATATVSVPPGATPKSSSSKTKSNGISTTATGAPVPPKLELHKELIPKNIEIVRCYYSQEIAPPGTTFGFDINGSGFTSEFEKMIRVEAGHDEVTIKNMHLVTANQLHGDMMVGSGAPTGFVYPRVLIKGLPVFRAPDPFAAVTDYLGAAIVATRDASAQFVRDLSRLPATYRRLMSHQRERIAGLERLIEEGTARGDFRGVHAKLIAEVMLNAVAQLVDPEVLARVGLTMSEAFAELYDIVEHGLVRGNGSTRAAAVKPRARRRRRQPPTLAGAIAPVGRDPAPID